MIIVVQYPSYMRGPASYIDGHSDLGIRRPRASPALDQRKGPPNQPDDGARYAPLQRHRLEHGGGVVGREKQYRK